VIRIFRPKVLLLSQVLRTWKDILHQIYGRSNLINGLMNNDTSLQNTNMFHVFPRDSDRFQNRQGCPRIFRGTV
jgi:hypothetical protein